MTAAEFDEFMNRHLVRHKGVNNAFEHEPKLVDVWRRALIELETERVERAADDILLLSPSPYPSEHLGIIFKNARNQEQVSQKWDPPTETYRCSRCRDSGFRLVYQPSTLKLAK